MRFRYLRDPLFLFCLALYPTNRFLLKPNFDSVFLHGYLNDLICIPFCVPLLLLGLRRLGLRSHDAPPGPAEIIIPLLVWATVFEVVLPAHPMFGSYVVGDPADILCYVLGGLGATLIWGWYYSPPPSPVERASSPDDEAATTRPPSPS